MQVIYLLVLEEKQTLTDYLDVQNHMITLKGLTSQIRSNYTTAQW
jgi:hypothetical protein